MWRAWFHRLNRELWHTVRVHSHSLYLRNKLNKLGVKSLKDADERRNNTFEKIGERHRNKKDIFILTHTFYMLQLREREIFLLKSCNAEHLAQFALASTWFDCHVQELLLSLALSLSHRWWVMICYFWGKGFNNKNNKNINLRRKREASAWLPAQMGNYTFDKRQEH